MDNTNISWGRIDGDGFVLDNGSVHIDDVIAIQILIEKPNGSTDSSVFCGLMFNGYEYQTCNVNGTNHYYGPGCALNCHCHEQCHMISGNCTTCRSGYYQETTPGICMLCHNGTWGINCSDECHCNDTGDVCNQETGECATGCEVGYYQDQNTMACVKCENGKWGEDCAEICHCANDTVCHHMNGTCAVGCADWYHGGSCNHGLPRFRNMSLSTQIDGKQISLVFLPDGIDQGDTLDTDLFYYISYFVQPNLGELRTKRNSDDNALVNDTANKQLLSTVINFTISYNLPDIRTSYQVRVVPYDEGLGLHGEPSPWVDVFTQCIDMQYGSDCHHVCTCKNETEVCNKIDGECKNCADGIIGDPCTIREPTEDDITVTYHQNGSNAIDVNIAVSSEYHNKYELVEASAICELNGDRRSVRINVSHGTGKVTDLTEGTNYTCSIVPHLRDGISDVKLYNGSNLHYQFITMQPLIATSANTNILIISVSCVVVVLVLVLVVCAILWFLFKRKIRNLASTCDVANPKGIAHESDKVVEGYAKEVSRDLYIL